jgi:hypothetical protein
VQYTTFGNAYGLATFIPMVISFFCAYYFDHLGVLSMAIANLAAWMGIAVTPLQIFRENNFADAQIIFAGLLLGVALNAIAWASKQRNIKAHFCFTYTNFGMNILFIACLAGMFHFDDFYLLWLLPLVGIVCYFYKRSIATSSFYIMLMLTLYGYTGISYVIIRLAPDMDDAIFLVIFYFILSGLSLISFLMYMNKKLRS